MTLEAIAETYRTYIQNDECGDPVIPGKHGILYVDHGKACIMLLDSRPVETPRLKALGGNLWQGDKSPNSKGITVQDVKVVGIHLDRIRDALRIIGAPKRRVLSPEERERLLAVGQGFQFPKGHGAVTLPRGETPSAEGEVMPGSHSNPEEEEQ